MNRLSNRVGIITGASSGIGRAAAHRFAREGAHLVLGARRAERLESLAEELRVHERSVVVVPGDVDDPDYAEALVERARLDLGGLDFAFNNAGTLGAMGPITELDLDGWEATLRTNLTAGFLAARAQIPALRARGRGSIVFTSTFVGETAGFGGMVAYAASKTGLQGLARALAVEAAPLGIRVNALLPGGTDTPMGRQIADTPQARAAVERLHALGRLASPDEIAASALYLVSDDASFVTGTALLVDGGVSVWRG